MYYQRRAVHEFTIEELDRELKARGARIAAHKQFNLQLPPGTNEGEFMMSDIRDLYDEAASYELREELQHMSISELTKILVNKTGKMGGVRGIWNKDERLDFYEIWDEQTRKNAECVSSVCMSDDLIDNGDGTSTLRVGNYGKSFNLCDCERFVHQPIASGPLCTGFLVGRDTIVTAGHFVKGKTPAGLRVVFGFRMEDAYTPAVKVPNNDIYEVKEITGSTYDRRIQKAADWALVKLARNVEERKNVELSAEDVVHDQQVYVFGHPLGLPLKYGPGSKVVDVHDACFTADLDIYGGSSGSPVFCSESHKVVGMVVRGDYKDFRWNGKCWFSIVYRSFENESAGPECTKVRQFKNAVDSLNK